MKSGSLGSYKIRGVFNFLREYKFKSMTDNNPRPRNVALATARPRSNVFGNHAQLAALRLVHVAANSSGGRGNDRPISSSSPKLPSPRPGFPIWVSGLIGHNFRWAKLILGSAFSLLLAVWTPKWATLLKLGGEAEVVIKEVEQAAEVMEKVAAVVEKASEEVAEELPDGSKFKAMALIIDHISKEAAKDAEIVDEILHKLDDVEKDVEKVEEIVEPLIDKIGHGDKSNEQVKS